MLRKFVVRIDAWRASDEGATALEYAILVAVIATVIVAGVSAFGTQLGNLFSRLASWVQGRFN